MPESRGSTKGIVLNMGRRHSVFLQTRCCDSAECLFTTVHTHAARANPYDPKHFFRETHLNCLTPRDRCLLDDVDWSSKDNGQGFELSLDAPPDQNGEGVAVPYKETKLDDEVDSDSCDGDEDYDDLLSVIDIAQDEGIEGSSLAVVGATGSGLEIDDNNNDRSDQSFNEPMCLDASPGSSGAGEATVKEMDLDDDLGSESSDGDKDRDDPTSSDTIEDMDEGRDLDDMAVETAKGLEQDVVATDQQGNRTHEPEATRDADFTNPTPEDDSKSTSDDEGEEDLEANLIELGSMLASVEVQEPRRSQRLKETEKKPLALTAEDINSSFKPPSNAKQQGARKRTNILPDDTESEEDTPSGEVVLLHYEDIRAQDIDERRRWVEDIVMQIEQDEVCPALISVTSS